MSLDRSGLPATSLQPDALFEGVLPGADVPGHRPFLSRARLERERGSERTSQASLAAFLVASLVDRMLGMQGTAEELDGFRWQLRSTQHFVRELPGDAPETAHLSAVVDSLDAEAPQRHAVVRMGLMAYAYFLNQEGRFEEALDILALAGRTHTEGLPREEFASFALFCGRVNRRLANWEAARRAFDASEQAAESVGDLRGMCYARLGVANLARATGDLPRAEAVVRQVLGECEGLDFADVRAAAYSDLSAAYYQQGRLVDSVLMEYRAFQCAADDTARWRSLGNLGSALHRLGEYQAARHALEVVAQRSELFSIRNNATIELIGLTSAVGDELGFHRFLRQAEEALVDMAPSMSVDFHYQAGVGMARFDRMTKAQEYLSQALALADSHGLNTWYFRIERVYQGLTTCADHTEAAKPYSPPYAPSLEDVTTGLAQFATATLA